jgi:SAM-dependent methyltransferase
MTRSCPVCQAANLKAVTYLSENIDKNKFTSYSFASRKQPEYMSHHMVQCQVCDVLYADHPPSESVLTDGYHNASYDSAGEADDAATAYSKVIIPILDKLDKKNTALEIGTGNGIFLLKLKELGFNTLFGVEPSAEAIKNAPEACAKYIVEGMFDVDNFQQNSFDLVCCFMTMEHVSDPKLITNSVYKLLRPGGVFVTITHDYRSLVNRILGKRSPIIDIEHLQIFSSKAIKELFMRSGYKDIYISSFKNSYSLKYWLRLCPIPDVAKRQLNGRRVSKILNRIKLRFNVGNVITAGFKPENN